MNESGEINADTININSKLFTNSLGSSVKAEQLALMAEQLNNAGLLLSTTTADNGLSLNVANFYNSGTLESHSTNLSLKSTNLVSQGGKIIHTGTGELYISGSGIFNNSNSNSNSTLATE